MHPKLRAMIAGFGPDFPKDLRDIFIHNLSDEAMIRLNSPLPGLGRYASNTEFLKEVTSAKRIGFLRFWIIKKYFFALETELAHYSGKFKDQKVISGTTTKNLMAIGNLCNMPEHVVQAELIEKFTDHDTAAAGDFLKMSLAYLHPELADVIDGIYFAITSEDIMANVFGLIGNELVFGHFMTALSNFCLSLIDFVRMHEANGPLILPGFTHRQAAEPTTLGKKLTVRLKAISRLVETLKNGRGGFEPFSGKLGGAIGNLTCHYAAYPDINWWNFADNFVTDLGLRYEQFTDQCTSYVEEARIFSTIENILTQIIKFADDFISLASCPAQFFVKRKKAGEKGSSLMPHKSNAWGSEGSIKMFLEAMGQLHTLARELPRYPHEGDMGRSYLFRNVGATFMPIFVGLKRLSGEVKKYHPSQAKIQQVLDEYPGMAASSIQTILKRAGVPGDAYRELQTISINKDGSYANREQFRENLQFMMEKLQITIELRDEINNCLDFSRLIEPVHNVIKTELACLEMFFKDILTKAAKHIPKPSSAEAG